MKKLPGINFFHYIIFSLIISVALIVILASAQDNVLSTYRVQGRVLDSQNQQGVPGAEAFVLGANGDTLLTHLLTDQVGYYDTGDIIITAITPGTSVPAGYWLRDTNYPNPPTSGETTWEWSGPSQQQPQSTVTDIIGRAVNKEQLPAGVYFYNVTFPNGETQTRKFVHQGGRLHINLRQVPSHNTQQLNKILSQYFTFHWHKAGYDDLEETVQVDEGLNLHDFQQNPKVYVLPFSVWNQTGNTPLQGAMVKLTLGQDEFISPVAGNGDAVVTVSRHEPEEQAVVSVDHPDYTNGSLVILDPGKVLSDTTSLIAYSLTTQGPDSAVAQLQDLAAFDVVVEALADSFYNDNDFRENVFVIKKMIGENWTLYNITLDYPSGQPISQQKIADHDYVLDYKLNHLVQFNGLRQHYGTKIIQPNFPSLADYIGVIFQDNSVNPGNDRYPVAGVYMTAFTASTRFYDPRGTLFSELYEALGIRDLSSNGSNTNAMTVDSLGNPVLNSIGEAVIAVVNSYPGGSDFRPNTTNSNRSPTLGTEAYKKLESQKLRSEQERRKNQGDKILY